MFLNNFDFISPNISLYFKEKRRHLSPLGGLLTIIIFFVLIYIIINYTLFKTYPNSSSLNIYRNYEIDKSFNYFNESGLFHFFWIYNNENLINNNELPLNNFKKGIIRIYMTYVYDKYEYNSLNLKDNDHWVYDTCHNYVDKNDLKYDFSYSSCIKYYYNSIDKKYYSILDNANFKWPYLKENITDDKNKNFFATFIEKCSNNSVLNELFGECYSEEKIENYLSYFNKVFISFVDNKIQINNKKNRISSYSHKIYDNIINNSKYFYLHELKFFPFNYEEQRNIISKKIVYNSFMFDGERQKKIQNNENNKLLLVYIFNVKKYINEFRNHDNYIFDFFHRIGGVISLLYYIFYIFNFFLNERVEVRNFQKFLNDSGGNIIQRHTNYERNKIYTLKSNLYTSVSNEINDQNKTFKPTHTGNTIKNDTNNIYNTINNRAFDNNYTATNIDKTKIEEKENTKKSENIIIINNGTFMNDNASNNNKINLKITNTIGKLESMKLLNKRNELDHLGEYNKTYTYTKNPEESQQKVYPTFKGKKNDSNVINFSNYSKNKNFNIINLENNENIDLSSKQKILDTSSISLLNIINKTQNLSINNPNYNNILSKKEMPLLNYQKYSESFTPKNSPKTRHYKYQKNIKNLLKDNHSQKENNLYFNNLSPISRKNNKKFNNNINTSNDHIKKRRRQSYQPRNTLRKQYEKDNGSEICIANKKKGRRKTGVFNINDPLNKHGERRLSIFSSHTNILNNRTENNRLFNIYPCDSYSQNNLSRNLVEHYKKIGLYKYKEKKIDKEIVSPSSDLRSKNQKKDNKSTIKFENSNKNNNNNKFKMVQNIKWTPRLFFDYLCLCRIKEKNDVYILNKFRHKLLSEEYLYILHLNMFIFKQKLGCKSNLEKNNLLEELYNDI